MNTCSLKIILFFPPFCHETGIARVASLIANSRSRVDPSLVSCKASCRVELKVIESDPPGWKFPFMLDLAVFLGLV